MSWNNFTIKFLCLLCMLFFHFMTFAGSGKDVPEWFSILSDSFCWTFLVISAPTLYLLICGHLVAGIFYRMCTCTDLFTGKTKRNIFPYGTDSLHDAGFGYMGSDVGFIKTGGLIYENTKRC